MAFEELIRKGIDNLRFALNLDDYVPEHIRQELMKRTEHGTHKVTQGADGKGNGINKLMQND